MPPVPVTVPVPAAWIVRATFASVNVAFTSVSAAPIVTAQPALPLHGASHARLEPVAGVACSVTCVPCGMMAEQVAPQLRLPPPGHVAVMVPEPFPSFAMTKFASLSANVAVTCVGAVTLVSVQLVAATLVQPDHILKSDVDPGAACSTRLEPTTTDAVHEVSVHVTPGPVTVPSPVRWIVTSTICSATSTPPPSGAVVPSGLAASGVATSDAAPSGTAASELVSVAASTTLPGASQ